MDNAEKAIEQVNADQIYTSKQFQRIKDNFFVSKYCDLDMDAHGSTHGSGIGTNVFPTICGHVI